MIKIGQTWLIRKRGQLKSTGQVQVVAVGAEYAQVERTFTFGRYQHRKDWIKFTSLRKRYYLLHEQESLV
jgi:hypothetical protein